MSTSRNAPAGTRQAYPFRPPRVTESSQPDNSFILKDLGDKVAKFKRSTATLSPVEITNVKPIASYSWIEAATPTIAVPGSPRVWFTGPQRVPADSGTRFVDQNAFYMRKMSPLIPLFAAIDDMNPSFNFKQFDFITDRNNLRKLLRWASGSPDEKDFRIDIDVAGTTCLFTRLEAQNTDTVQGFMGYAHEYEKAATRVTRGCERATGHHRMISIDIGELKVLLRFTIEACTSSTNDTNDEDDLLAAFSGLGIGGASVSSSRDTKKPQATVPTVRGVTIRQTTPRKVVPQSSLIELKTRAARREIDWAEVYPQLYLSQTAFLYIAKHERGSFNTLEKVELGSESMQTHARRTQQGVAKLKLVLQDILDAVKKEDVGVGLSLVAKDGKLALYKRHEGTGKGPGKDITDKFN
ncbi:uncharacterized protein F5147DRAFT_693865 [Suillus discolor]|uniref:Geranylgeranyl pyrophosphate synthetase n=1 Tax=Suillus discolor TaxID=1912936 RepID=A0A9P7F951_9AGAM|nr:uncharacterized protein F5147DRAFT_693865 [Suillus discolor]KAG2109056.1 hypothetical protein F5147DRAFT_693865 [Suillus discolor]